MRFPCQLPTFPRSLRYARRSFTLIELMAVVVLLGIAATIVLLRLESAVGNAQLEAVASEIEQTYRLATQEARTRNRPVTLAIDITNAGLRIERNSDAASNSRDWRSIDGVQVAEVYVGTTRHISGIGRIRVTPSGVSLPWTLKLTKGNRQLSLNCNGIAGVFTRERKIGPKP